MAGHEVGYHTENNETWLIAFEMRLKVLECHISELKHVLITRVESISDDGTVGDTIVHWVDCLWTLSW